MYTSQDQIDRSQRNRSQRTFHVAFLKVIELYITQMYFYMHLEGHT